MDKSILMVSIRCTAYNHEPYIRQCLEGFIMQKTNFRFEAIVHDDASTDGTATIIKEYADKYPDIIKPIFETENQHSKRDGSLRRIMNSHMKGKYIAYCEGDDYWTDPLKLQKQVDFLEGHPEYGLIYTYFDILYQYSGKIVSAPRPHRPSGYVLRELLLHNFIATPTVLMNADIYQRCIERLQGKKWEMGDYPLWLEFALCTKIKYLSDKTVVYRHLLHSASHPNSLDKYILFHKSCMAIQCLYAEKSKNNDLLPYIIEHYNVKMYQICIENGYSSIEFKHFFRGHKCLTRKGKMFNMIAKNIFLEKVLRSLLGNMICKKIYSTLS